MRLRKKGFTGAAFLLATALAGNAGAQTQYVYPGDTYANTNYGAQPTYQRHYPATSSSSYPAMQYPAATSSNYVTPAAQPTPQYLQSQQPYQPGQSYQAPQYQAAQPTQQYQPPQQSNQPQQYQTAQAAPQTWPAYQPAPAAAAPQSTGSLPSYSYNRQLDPTYQPPYNPNGVNGSAPSSSPGVDHNYGVPYLGLETRSGLDLTAQLAYYRYSEPGLGVTEESDDPLLGLNVRGTLAFGQGFYVSAEGRYAFVDIDYTGSGEIDDRSVDSWEWRGLFGKDIIFQQFSLTPYTGFGYRTLFNDNRGITTDGAAGYRRYNQLYYLPIGIQPRTHIDSNARLTSLIEFDAVLHGVQKSDFADAGLGDPNVKNGQSSGYGLRGEIMYETRTWSVGPYFTYWNMDDSNTKFATDNSSVSCGQAGLSAPCILVSQEPANHTIEAGVQFRYHFF